METTTKLHTHTVDRLSSFINPRDENDDDDDESGRTGIAMPVAVVGCCCCGDGCRRRRHLSLLRPSAVRIEQFLTDVRRRVYDSVSAVCFERRRSEREGE